MPRKKIISANDSIFVGPSPASAAHTLSAMRQLYNVTAFDFNVDLTKEDVITFGSLAPVDRVSLEPPTIAANVTYNSTTLNNEQSLGLVTNGLSGAFAKILNGQADEQNIFLAQAGDGTDANGVAGAGFVGVVGFGNAVISSYDFEAAVGDFPTTTLGFQAINVETYPNGNNQNIPAINPSNGLRYSGTFTLPTASGLPFGQSAALMPGDITVNFNSLTGLVYTLSGSCVQSVSINVDFGRTPIQCLGSKYFTSNDIAGTIPLTFSADVFAQDIKTGSLATFLCNQTGGSANVTVRRPNCVQGAGAIAYNLELRNIAWVGESTTIASDGTPQIVTVNFEGYIGGANDVVNGLFMSGIVNT